MTGPEFKSIRRDIGLTQAQLGHVLDVSAKTIAKWEAPPDRSTARSVNPIAARAIVWMRSGFRPPEWPTNK